MTVRDVLAYVALAMALMPIICFTCSVIINMYFDRKEKHMRRVATDDSFWDIVDEDQEE